MVKVLIYGNRKMDSIIWDISTDKKKSAAYLALFTYLRDEWQVYDGLLDPEEDFNKTKAGKLQRELYDAACKGDAISAYKLLGNRKDYEYEEWTYGEVLDPTKDEIM